jgi:hypothetical protein
MPRSYTSKKTGRTRVYAPSSGPNANLTLLLRDPSLAAELRDVAQCLNLVQDRGLRSGQGSLSQLVEALGQAARRDGAEAVAKWLKPLVG